MLELLIKKLSITREQLAWLNSSSHLHNDHLAVINEVFSYLKTIKENWINAYVAIVDESSEIGDAWTKCLVVEKPKKAKVANSGWGKLQKKRK
jgi:hypothetical protein